MQQTLRTVVIVLRTAAPPDFGDPGGMIRDAERVDIRMVRDASVLFNGESIELVSDTTGVKTLPPPKPQAHAKTKGLIPAEKLHHGGKLVVETVQGATGPRRRINVVETLRNLGVTIDEMMATPAKAGSLIAHVKSSYVAQMRVRKARKGKKHAA